MTPAYAFTDYRSQGQTIMYIVVDITTPPGGSMFLFNLYVALSRSSGHQTIRILRDFDETTFFQPINEMLTKENQCLQEQNTRTKTWWEQIKNGVAQTPQCLSS
ncbi:uncharacterized protein LAESUDRAFT_650294 [Laetiporus sulphureus 93-53]|uniref:UvrD-like helicase C-terminal domain-containing protein n=1 Tax=Laetiporus sulphureus 93-53 TaxID=1314785 RepID=A0A165EVW4_9APHY|nr:uncharacterized protein LAESUDRAFT_650294 [Laetiporus sulphureus 93-53]KZT07875.1 hypothetical protein LAESUDRAFT_650294 [Laetiporus sulphureus 93-53]